MLRQPPLFCGKTTAQYSGQNTFFCFFLTWQTRRSHVVLLPSTVCCSLFTSLSITIGYLLYYPLLLNYSIRFSILFQLSRLNRVHTLKTVSPVAPRSLNIFHLWRENRLQLSSNVTCFSFLVSTFPCLPIRASSLLSLYNNCIPSLALKSACFLSLQFSVLKNMNSLPFILPWILPHFVYSPMYFFPMYITESYCKYICTLSSCPRYLQNKALC